MATLTDAQRADGWKIVKLGDATTKIGSGSTPRGGKSAYTENGAILIRSQNVLDNKLDFMDAVHISAEAEQKLKSVKVYAGDVLLNITGSGNTTIGRSAYVKNLPEVAYVNQHVSIIRVDLKKINPIYLQKYLMAFKDSLLSLSYGSTRDALTKRIIEDFEIALPPLEEQERIAAILGSLDDKIEANNRIIQTMSDIYYESHNMALPFKKNVSVKDIVDIIRVNVPVESIDQEILYVALDNLPRRNIFSHSWEGSSQIMSNKSSFQKGDILFGKLRPYFHKVSVAAIDGICSTDILVFRPKPGLEGLAYGILGSDDIIEYATQMSSGTRMPRVSWKDIMDYKTTITYENIENLNLKMMNFHHISSSLIRENIILAESHNNIIKKLIG